MADVPRRRLPDGDSYVLVLDLEATGAAEDAIEHGHSVLEVGFVLCRDDVDLTQVGEGSAVVRPPGTRAELDAAFLRYHPKVRDMHNASGLWAEATDPSDDGTAPVYEVEAQILSYLQEQVGDEPIALAGSGVSHYDSPWLAAHLPRLKSRLTYWSLDAGVMRRLLQYARRDDLVDLVGDVDAKPHRAHGDAVLHAAELRKYLRLLRAIPSAEDVRAAAIANA